MGIRGLYTFITNDRDLFTDYELHSTKLIIDGNNIFVDMTRNIRDNDFLFGGDYRKIKKKIETFLANLKRCKIEPIVIFDGSMDRKSKLETLISRQNQRLRENFDMFGTNKYSFADLSKMCRESPMLAMNVFLDILTKENISAYRCSGDADNFIALLANFYQCPVLSRDSDFCIYDLKVGYVIYSLNELAFQKDSGDDFLRVRIYKVSLFEQKYEIESDLMPLFATILGNDFSHRELMTEICSKMIPNKINIQSVLTFLKGKTCNEIMDAMVSHVSSISDGKILIDAVEESVKMYRLDPNMFGNSLVISDFICDSYVSKDLPAWFCKKYTNLEIPSWTMHALLNKHIFLYTVLEDFSLPSVDKCCEDIKLNVYSILLPKCSTITEYFRFPGEDSIRDVELNILDIVLDENDFQNYSNSGNNDSENNCVKFSQLFNCRVDLFSVENFPENFREILFFKCATFTGIQKKAILSKFPRSITIAVCSLVYWIKRVIEEKTDPVINGLITGVYVYLSTYHFTGNVDCPFFAKTEKLRNDWFNHILDRHNVISPNSLIVALIHKLNQWQSVVSYLNSLNAVLNFPFDAIKMAAVFSGPLCAKLTCDIFYKQRPFSESLNELGLWRNQSDIVKKFREQIIQLADM